MQYRLIRGARIIQWLNEDSTIPQLHRNIEVGFPDTKKRQHVVPEVTVQKMEFIPRPGQGMLEVKSSTTSNGSTYQQDLQFLKVVFGPSDTSITISSVDGSDPEIVPIVLNDTNVKVRCSCLDFHYRFATWNFNDQSLVGPKPPPYTKTSNRPPVNPSQSPGVCKHILKVVDDLKQQRIVTG